MYAQAQSEGLQKELRSATQAKRRDDAAAERLRTAAADAASRLASMQELMHSTSSQLDTLTVVRLAPCAVQR